MNKLHFGQYEWIYRICRNLLLILAVVLTGLVFLLNLLFTSKVASTGYEIVTVYPTFLPGVLMLVVLCSLGVIVYNNREKLNVLDEKKFFRILAVLYTVFAFYLIFNIDDTIRADAKTVFTAALQMKAGDYSALQTGHYLYRYPHQLGLVVYDQLLTAFSENTLFVFFINFLMVLGINHTCWKISEHLFHHRLTNLFTIFFSFAFLPQLFFILFAYGLIPGFFFMMLAFYHTLCYVSRGKWKNMAAMIVCLGAAVLLKQNFLIGGIAILIYLFLQVLKDGKLRNLAVMAVLLLSMILPAEVVKLSFGQAADVKLNNASPSILWIAMGTDIDNCVRGPGWYDSSSWNLYNSAAYDAGEASRLGKEKLESNWEKIKKEPARAGKFFLDKTISQWCDPMYESVWSGPLEDCGQYTHTEILQSLYTGGTWAESIATGLKMLCLALWALALGFLVFTGKEHTGWELMYLFFIGGLLFHIFWEGKSQYTYPYLFVLIPFAANTLRQILYGKKA